MTTAKQRLITCPTCRKRGDWFTTPFGPFCSERCKLVDLGKWLGEEHRIGSPLRLDHLEHIEDLPSDAGATGSPDDS